MPLLPEQVKVVVVALLLLAAIAPVARLRSIGAAGIALILVVGGLAVGVLVPLDLLMLPSYLGLQSGFYGLLAWTLFGLLGAAAGGPRLVGPAILRAALSGFLLGELGAALSFLPVQEHRSRARLVLAAMAGAMVGRVGDPGLLVLGGQVQAGPWILAPLALIGLLLSGVRSADLPPDHGHFDVTAVAAVVALLLPQHVAVVLALGCLAMAVLALRRRAAPSGSALLWVGASLVVALVACSAGLPYQAVLQLEDRLLDHSHLYGPVLGVGSLLLAALLDGPAAALILGALSDQALLGPTLFGRPDGLALALMAGLAVGGLGPLHLAGVLGPALPRWLLLGLLTLPYVLWMLR